MLMVGLQVCCFNTQAVMRVWRYHRGIHDPCVWVHIVVFGNVFVINVSFRGLATTLLVSERGAQRIAAVGVLSVGVMILSLWKRDRFPFSNISFPAAGISRTRVASSTDIVLNPVRPGLHPRVKF